LIGKIMMKFKMLVGSMLAAGAMGAVSLAHAATTANGSMDVSATLTSACEVSATGAAIDLGSVVALASTAAKEVSNASDFKVACTSGLSPVIYSTTTRAMSDGTHSLPFALCLGGSCTGSNPLASTSTGDALPTAVDGSLHPVALTAKIVPADFKTLPAGAYTATVTINVDY
jgi:spore coat protein U-like protein